MAFIKFKPIGSKENFYQTLSNDEIKANLDKILEPREDIIIGFKSFRDMGVFTNKRIILVNKKGVRGFCQSVLSIKYDSISSYCLNVHSVDSSIELIFDSGYQMILNFLKPIPLDDMYLVYRYISDYVLNKKN
ncbi:MAG: PH domain-containing protein [Bacilli bacterium]|nr:PH domain-containing protein [Bacilli bacterium]